MQLLKVWPSATNKLVFKEVLVKLCFFFGLFPNILVKCLWGLRLENRSQRSPSAVAPHAALNFAQVLI